MGIGEIPDAVLDFLEDKKHLGVHTEMFSDGLVDLFEAGVVTNERKTLHRGKIVASFVIGTRRAFDFVDNNPFMEFHPNEYVNDPYVVARNDNMVAINSALAVDLTGQVCADSIGTRIYSGFGASSTSSAAPRGPREGCRSSRCPLPPREDRCRVWSTPYFPDQES
jgi:acetyl-CoA hydrolase